jgi:ribokinase
MGEAHPNSVLVVDLEASRSLLRRGIKNVFIKLNTGDCVVTSSREATLIRAVPVKVIDKTGAGDAFAGALAVALLEGHSPARAGLFAVAAAHVAVTKYGSQPAYPDQVEIEKLSHAWPMCLRWIIGP